MYRKEILTHHLTIEKACKKKNEIKLKNFVPQQN